MTKNKGKDKFVPLQKEPPPPPPKPLKEKGFRFSNCPDCGSEIESHECSYKKWFYKKAQEERDRKAGKVLPQTDE